MAAPPGGAHGAPPAAPGGAHPLDLQQARAATSPGWPGEAAPKARGARAAYACYFLLGAGVLAPWNALLMAADYWAAVFPGRHVDRTFTVCYLPVCLLLIGAFIRFPRAAGEGARVLAGFAGFFVAMLAVPLVRRRADGEDEAMRRAHGRPACGPGQYLTALIMTTAHASAPNSAAADALEQVLVFCLVLGLLLGALLGWCWLFNLLATRAGLRASTRLYFAFAAALSAACFGVYAAVLPRIETVDHWRRRRAAGGAACAGAEAGAPLEGGGGGRTGDDEEPLMWPQAAPSQVGSPAQPPQPPPQALPLAAAPGWQACLRAEWRLALALTFVYVVTLAIFPGALAEDAHSAALGDWFPILLMTAFNFSDLLGKNAPLPPPPPGGAAARHARLLRWSLARALFLPLCVGATRLGAPVAVLALLCVLLGASNGYLTALIMTTAHASAPNSAAADALEQVLVFCLVLGLLLGALLGWCWLL
ncbi:hypothetical protein Rsub_10793 [Raphidocelis subcapitata]|uniref:Equilibrative nucleoside transporter n=1 Tax=Raphidocelis subcapitata TaxID=307507 RepID=A0A2V0PFI3_9CHLO|nr:hypothetical protein Rsub_10793 [Raphidocelis subcapitata]|eukprot:GBF98604.1 hypothetical protein Rsub_10793 [Raphidocelis subcapitata]